MRRAEVGGRARIEAGGVKDGKIAREIGRDVISILRNLWLKFCLAHVALANYCENRGRDGQVR